MSPGDLSPPQLPVPEVDLLAPEEVERHFEDQRKPVDAVPTPLEGFNEVCRDAGGGVGLARGWHVTVAATTGSGKSLLALNLAAEAIRHGETVGFVSLEMSKRQVRTRLYAILTETPVRGLERGDFSSHVQEEVGRGLARIREKTGGTFRVNDGVVFELEKVLGLMRYWAERRGVRFFVVDYLQLLAARDAETLYQEVSNISAAVREFAQRMEVVTVGLSQLNRAASSNYQDSPRAQSLIGSSSLENDSDLVLLLDHSRYRKDGKTAKTWAILGKNRHGGQAEIPVEWDYRTLTIREALPDEVGEWPGVNGR